MLRLVTYLAPSIPAAFYEAVARAIRTDTGIEVELCFEEGISGPSPGDDNPFANNSVDVGFVCTPTYKWSREVFDLLALPLPIDSRAQGRAVYFADVTVHAGSRLRTFDDLRGCSWAYNDRNSLSGWFSMLDYLAPEQPQEFFGELRQAGSHLESLQLLHCREVDAACIDSNALNYYMKLNRDCSLRVIDSLGPFPIQPVVIRSSIAEEIKQVVRRALLNAHNKHGRQLAHFGFERFIEVDAAAYA